MNNGVAYWYDPDFNFIGTSAAEDVPFGDQANNGGAGLLPGTPPASNGPGGSGEQGGGGGGGRGPVHDPIPDLDPVSVFAWASTEIETEKSYFACKGVSEVVALAGMSLTGPFVGGIQAVGVASPGGDMVPLSGAVYGGVETILGEKGHKSIALAEGSFGGVVVGSYQTWHGLSGRKDEMGLYFGMDLGHEAIGVGFSLSAIPVLFRAAVENGQLRNPLPFTCRF